jgi:hypothetical protein
MKTQKMFRSSPSLTAFFFTASLWIAFLLAGVLAEAPLGAASLPTSDSVTLEQPVITDVRTDATNVIVSVNVPSGVTKITLESRSRLGAGTWAPAAVQRLQDRQGGILTFTLPRTESLALLRVRADVQEALPSFFYQGQTSFADAGSPTTIDTGSSFAAGNGAAATPTDTSGTTTTTRTVVESDIWKIDGDTMYFFNQYRGLQVIDISSPSAPVVTGTLDLPASGEQMYLPDTNHAVLLTRNWCSGPDSRVIIARIDAGVPVAESTLTVPGYIQESRMVGTALYVASETSRPIAGDPNNSWEWGTMITSFDLSDPSKPVSKGSAWAAGYGNVITATDQYLFVAIQEPSAWYQSSVQIYDISAPDGTVKSLSKIEPSGWVQDKFKMNVSGDTFTVISASWDTVRRWVTTLETYSLADPSKPVALGKLELAHGDQLHATRFDGERAYIVTFFQIDPLWVVDLTNPAKPAIQGKLEVPGWSTYIEPLGDRLVAIGIDNSNSWRVAVSLFDVSDPSNPTLVSKVPLGDNYSWSEANNDEKAFNVMPDEGLILVPYQGYETNGVANRVQLIDLNLADHSTNALKLRGVIDHPLVPRRAALHRDTILSINGWELLSVNAADRDNPITLATVDLAWAADQVLLSGDYLLEFANSQNYYYWQSSPSAPILRVARANQPGTILGKLTLEDNLNMACAAIRGNRLYVAQAATYYYPWILATTDASGATVDTNTPPPTLILSVFDISQLPTVTRLGRESLSLSNYSAYGLQMFWPKDDILVLGGAGSGSYYGVYPMLNATAVMTAILPGYYYPWYGGQNGQLMAFNVSDAANPQFVSQVTLSDTNRWGFSQPFSENSLLYITHQESEFIPVGTTVPPTGSAGGTVKPVTVLYDTNGPIYGSWVYRYYLDVVDYTDPNNPITRAPVNVPGSLAGISHQGAVVYTAGYRWKPDGTTDWSLWLDALAYDGVSAHYVDSLALSTGAHPIVITGEDLLIGHADTTTNNLNTIETWILGDNAKFIKLGATTLKSPADTMVLFGDLLAVHDYTGAYLLYDATDPVKTKLLSTSDYNGCYWADLRKADGALNRGLWLPLGVYGVKVIPITTGP